MTLITAEGVSLELGTGWRSGSKKWNGGANGPRQMFDDIFSPLDTIHECDRWWRAANDSGGPVADDSDGGR